MKKSFLFILMPFLVLTAMKSDKEAWRFFDTNGKKVDYQDVLKAATKADIVLFGEEHNSSICHWMELQLARDMYHEIGNRLVMGAEMFESDNQIILDEYLAGKIKASNFEQDARLWKNYKTDYKPLVELAAKEHLRFIATDIPRRYAAMVYSKSFESLDSLTAEAKKYIAPLPVKYDPELKGYKSMLEMGKEMPGHSSENLPKAQAIKDATMAHFILQNWEKGKIFLHYNGTYHSDNFEGIVWYLNQENPDLNIVTISTVEQDTITELKEDNKGLGTFIFCVPSDMTKTY